MSKNTKTVKQPLSTGAKKAIWITAICLVAVIALTVSLGYILNNSTINPDNDESNSSGSSTLKIPNGDFLYTKSESTQAPYEAQNWAKKTYNSATSFGTIEDEQKVVMGVVNTTASAWNDIISAINEKVGYTIKNPNTHKETGVIDKEAVSDDDIDIANVYMIATKGEATNASILSDSFSIASSSSVRITIWLKIDQITAGNASVMVQYSNTPAEDNRYAYDLEVKETVTENGNGWQKHELYVFNRSSASKSVRVNVGLGDVYNGTTAEGVLFIDDITYETVTANEYRLNYSASTSTDAKKRTSHIIKSTDEDEGEVNFTDWNGTADIGGVDEYLTNGAPDINGTKYSPFVKGTEEEPIDNFKIYKADSSNSFTQTLALKNSKDDADDYLHIYFWMRVDEGNEMPQASIVDIIVRDNSETDETKNLAKLTNIGDVDDVTTDVNCGWKQYHIYVKPDQDIIDGAKVSVSIKWSNTGIAANQRNGNIYVSDLMYEFIADTTYTSVSTSTTTVTADFNKTHASTGVTNGTFGYLEDVDKTQPESWTPVYAGSNYIYNDGKGNTTEAPANGDYTNRVVKGDSTTVSKWDDEYGYYLELNNSNAVSQGYLSQSISLSAKSVYRISVLARTEGEAKPFIYLINQAAAQDTDGSREKAIIGKFESAATNSKADELLMQPVQINGWVRYYFIVETADKSVSVNVALFNGSIDGTTTQTGTVCYDQVCVEQLGSYTVAEDTDNEDAKLYKVTYTEKSDSGYADLFDTYFADVDGNTETMNTIEFKDGETAIENIKVIRLADDDKWEEMRQIPEEEEEDDTTDDDDTTTTTENDVDVALLLSVISSILLVACLLVVIVIKAFKKKRA